MKFNKKWWLLTSVVGLACSPMATSGCSGQDDVRENGSESTAVSPSALTPELQGISAFRARAGAQAFLRDEPATANFERVRAAFAQGRPVAGKLGIYELEPVGDVAATLQRRAAELGIRGEVVKKVNHSSIKDGVSEIRIGDRSGAERSLVTELFHQGPGTADSRSDDEYLAIANRRASAVGSTLPLADLYPYKIRRYKNAISEGEAEPEVSTYQVAVAFNQSIDDLPVIGSGGKLVIHMTTDGQPVGHEFVIRKVKSTVKELDGSALSDPDRARAEVEARLARSGIDMSKYRAVRSEFGYQRLGRDNTQNVLAPHYGFYYEALDGVSKKLVEYIPALKDPSLRAIAERDTSENQARKAARRQTETPRR
ncbi:hypothetical protein LZC95_40690 [Pendulispora brunnea]|uniref:Uncharacterized protein n=1 Tax=Pendulispora brunnea TaxID=2905690 RepID=A0ABZ2K5W7_9BACT